MQLFWAIQAHNLPFVPSHAQHPNNQLHSLGSIRRPPASALFPVLEYRRRARASQRARSSHSADHLGDPCSALVLGSERALSGSIEYRRRARASQRARSSHSRIISATLQRARAWQRARSFPVLEYRRRARASQRARSARSRITSVTHGSALFPVIESRRRARASQATKLAVQLPRRRRFHHSAHPFCTVRRKNFQEKP